MIGSFTLVDLALIAIAALSALLAMYRGLTRELLSITSWIVAFLAVLYFIVAHERFAGEVALQMGVQLKIAQIIIGAFLFLIVLIVVHLITSRISDAILDSRVGMIDRIFGFCFGLVRGFVIVLIPFMFYETYFPENQHEVVAKAQSRDMLVGAGNAIRPTMERIMEQLQTRVRGDEQQG